MTLTSQERRRIKSGSAAPRRQDAIDQLPIPKRSKYRNLATIIDGVRFDSKGEARWFQELRLLERAGEIVALTRQERYRLSVNEIEIGVYVADAAWIDRTGKVHIADFKGMDTPLSKWKRKHVEAEYGIQVEIVKGRG